jgi:hypothetical protein
MSERGSMYERPFWFCSVFLIHSADIERLSAFLSGLAWGAEDKR